MRINACIYDVNQQLIGCISNSVIEKFKQEYEQIQKLFPGFKVNDWLYRLLLKSKQTYTAQFLNGLKRVSKDKKLPIQYLQIISRAYHNLLQYCCSNVVYNEVLGQTIELFRKKGIEYKGSGVQGVNTDECAFIYNGITVGIKMKKKDDLYHFWNRIEKECSAVVYNGNDHYFIIENMRSRLPQAIIGCINDIQEVAQDSMQNIIIELQEILKKIKNINIQ